MQGRQVDMAALLPSSPAAPGMLPGLGVDGKRVKVGPPSSRTESGWGSGFEVLEGHGLQRVPAWGWHWKGAVTWLPWESHVIAALPRPLSSTCARARRPAVPPAGAQELPWLRPLAAGRVLFTPL